MRERSVRTPAAVGFRSAGRAPPQSPLLLRMRLGKGRGLSAGQPQRPLLHRQPLHGFRGKEGIRFAKQVRLLLMSRRVVRLVPQHDGCRAAVHRR